MKKLLFTVLLAAGMTAQADDYKYLTFACNGTEQSVTLETIQKITFEDGLVVVATSDGSVSFTQSQMEKMYFSASAATAIQTVDADAESEQTEVYDLSGRKMSNNNLKKGIYIINGKKVIR